MNSDTTQMSMLFVDDNPMDNELLQEALEESGLPYQIHFLSNGDALVDYLLREGEHADAPSVQMVLLDLNMPGRGGRALLTDLKTHPLLRRVPVIVFTGTWADSELAEVYDLGANAVVIKPVGFEALVDSIETMTRFWLQTAALPSAGAGLG